jgi:hypothetical protein
MQQLHAHESDGAAMARFAQAHLELVHVEYEFYDARDGHVKKTSEASPSTMIKVESEDSDRVNWG